MRGATIVSVWVLVAILHVGSAGAMRPVEKREDADIVVSGRVLAVYARESEGYREYIVEIQVEQVEKGAGVAPGDIFRAYCYQRKEGKGGLQFDTAGHTKVPKEGERVKAYVKRGAGRNEGIYPDWIDVGRL